MTSEVFQPLSAMLHASALEDPNRPALVFEGQITSWQQCVTRINRVASALLDLGIRSGDRVAITAAPCPAYVELLMGTVVAGGCAVPLPTMADPLALARMIAHSDARVLAVGKTARDLVRPVQDRLSQRRFPVGRIALDFEASGWIPFARLVSGATTDTHAAPIDPDRPFNIIYSSGTTGEPKGVVQSHRMRWHQVQRMRRLGFGAGAVTLVATPLCSNATLIALLPTLVGGGTVVLMPRFDERRFLQHAQEERVTHTLLVPVMYRRLLHHMDFARSDLRHFEVKVCTGAPFTAELKRKLLQLWPGRLVEIYGLTEGGATTLLDAGACPSKLESVGRPAEGVQIRILDPQGRELPQGGTGEIVGRAVSMMSGYHERPDLTEAISWRDAQGRLFYRTGDLGHMDTDGFLYLKGRARELIISGGLNIHPVDLEQVLLGHPAVAEVAVIGIPSRRWGESPLAVVTLKAGQAAVARELCEWANERLGKAQRLARVEIMDHLPRNDLGKVLTGRLRSLYK